MKLVRLFTAAAVAGALALPAMASAQADPALTNLDDHSTDAAYAAWFTQEVDWSHDNCEGTMLGWREEMECATVKTPRDWHDPAKGSIVLAMGRKIGVDTSKRLLLSNPGGPGVEDLAFGSYLLEDWLKTEDTHWSVGVDPRGVGSSTPVKCTFPRRHSPDSYLADRNPRSHTRAGVRAAARDRAAMLKACVEENRDLAPYINTEQTARDMNLVRHLLGQKTADYYGVSYGSWLGALMEKMFPESFDRVVVDGIADWTRPIEGTFNDMIQLRQASYDRQLLPFLAAHDDLYHLGTTPTEVNATAERVRAALVRDPYGPMSAMNFDLMIQSGLYGATGFHQAGSLISRFNEALQKPDARQALAAVVGESPTPEWTGWDFAFYNISCADTPNTSDVDTYYSRRAPLAAQLPLNGVQELFPRCVGWPLQPSLSPELMKRPIGQALMVQNEADPATGYRGAVNAHAAEPGTRMVTIDDQAWHGVPQRFNECARQVVDGYLKDGVHPDADVHCQAGPLFSDERDWSTGESILHHNTEVWEFRYPGTKDRRPRLWMYGYRDLSQPRIDQAATDAIKAPPAPPSVGRTASANDMEMERLLLKAAMQPYVWAADN